MVHMSDFTGPVYAQAGKNRLVAKKGSADRRRGEKAMMARAAKKMEIAEKKKAEAEAAAGGASTSSSSSAGPPNPTPTATDQKKRVIPKKAPPKKPSGKVQLFDNSQRWNVNPHLNLGLTRPGPRQNLNSEGGEEALFFRNFSVSTPYSSAPNGYMTPMESGFEGARTPTGAGMVGSGGADVEDIGMRELYGDVLEGE
ncbi:hypothetical protein CF319_g6809 [Tilletia indica]|nr:hypothetical protein CF319_g6809 [Tilletia indica]